MSLVQWVPLPGPSLSFGACLRGAPALGALALVAQLASCATGREQARPVPANASPAKADPSAQPVAKGPDVATAGAAAGSAGAGQKGGTAQPKGDALGAKRSVTDSARLTDHGTAGRPGAGDGSTKPALDAGAAPSAGAPAAGGAVLPDRAAIEALDNLARYYQVVRTRRGHAVRMPSDDLFEPGQWALTSRGRFRLDGLVSVLRTLPVGQVHIEAHTDSLGKPESNEQAAELRAQALRDYLIERGVPAERLRAEGRGAKVPIASNATAEGRTINRRLEITIER
jgi:outer membrane protein OmpA-like peptidoglycan-associated protein